jgi:hypothetical protein
MVSESLRKCFAEQATITDHPAIPGDNYITFDTREKSDSEIIEALQLVNWTKLHDSE